MNKYYLTLFLCTILLTGCTKISTPTISQTNNEKNIFSSQPSQVVDSSSTVDINISNSPETSVNRKGVVIINDNEILLPTSKCEIKSTVGGPSQYSFEVTFYENNKRKLSFAVQEPNNNPDKLLTIGAHTSTGQHWDRYGNYLKAATYSIAMAPEDMDIFLDKVIKNDNKFSIEGYINIKRIIKGFDDQSLSPQKIYFTCSDFLNY